MSVPLAFEGIKVVDFSQGVAGPHAGLLMAMHGADVIKIEPTERGDWSRALGRSYGDSSAFSIYYNRGKRSLALDMKSGEGRDIARRLVARADVIIEAFRPGVMKRFGLDYDSVKRLNENVVFLSVTGFGQTGANIERPATDAVIQGYSGLMSLNKDRNGLPQRFPMVAIDVVTGLYACQAVMAALMRRFRFGGGQYIDCSLLQCATAFQAARLIEHHFQGGLPEVMYVPLGVLQTKDSFISISVNRDEHFVAFCRAIGHETLAVDPRYATRDGRVQHEEELMALIRREFLQRSTAEWVERLTNADVLHAPIRSYDDLLQDQEMRDLGYLDWMRQGGIDAEVPIPNIPGTLRATAYGSLSASPRVGQHSREVLAELGVAEREISDLLSRGIAKSPAE
ncbi:CoA transferase [Bradyrhizobium sp. LHD-71]|uniref:CaiB/BaiF CoA transferase family protein n=1 Tax=Bradyrhizobium sp. LHD-71 TaxID=3072141 RepID=UPI00280E6AD2|nr:CoA transferase [Bradyrhizobium sp. LHD-71]MDQ8728216.1 CoA transferase [Bradyrhizobium sp. LHD-71]